MREAHIRTGIQTPIYPFTENDYASIRNKKIYSKPLFILSGYLMLHLRGLLPILLLTMLGVGFIMGWQDKQINKKINFDFIYKLAASHDSTPGSKSIDSVMMIKCCPLAILYRIKSRRQLLEEVNLNIAYHWFCGLELSDKVRNIRCSVKIGDEDFVTFPFFEIFLIASYLST